METSSKVFAMAMVCFLAMALVLSASDVAKDRALTGEDEGGGNPNESNEKVSSSPSTISPPFGNQATNQRHTLPPQSQVPPPESPNSGPTVLKSPPSAESEKLVPPPGPEHLNPSATKKAEDETSRSPSDKQESKAPEAPKEEGNKPSQSVETGDHKGLQAPLLVNKAPQVPKAINEQEQNEGTSKSGNPDKNISKSDSCETAKPSNLICRTGMLVACLLQSGTDSAELSLVIQNTGEDDLNVNITSPGKIKIDSKTLNLQKQSNKKVNLMADASMDLKITLNAGKGDCVLQTKTPESDWLYLQQFPAYAAQVRPMHGAYFLFATLIIAGGTWAFCKFGKKEKRVDAGIPYQQLEMATHTRSASAPAHVIAADSWSQGWDDDWDDEEAVIGTSAKQATENVSSNGLSSRPANPSQNGWEIDWDD